MKLTNEFRVPLPPSEAWALLNNVERVVPCLPGAELIEARSDRSYVGKVAVRLGPVALSFQGTVTYQEVDEAQMRVKAHASGSEQKARGMAQADVVFKVDADGDGSLVKIDTDLQLAGSIAQYARGGKLVQTAAQVIIDELALNLANQLEAESAGLAPGAGEAAQGAKPISAAGLLWKTVQHRVTGKGAKPKHD